MKEYLYPALLTALCAGLALGLSPGGSIGKSVKAVCALCVSAILVLPLFGIIGNFDITVPQTAESGETEAGEDRVIDALQKELCRRYEKEIFHRFGEGDCKIEIDIDRSDTENLVIRSMTVSYGERSREAAAYLEAKTGIKTEAR